MILVLALALGRRCMVIDELVLVLVFLLKYHILFFIGQTSTHCVVISNHLQP